MVLVNKTLIDIALAAMKARAGELGVQGVAVVLVQEEVDRFEPHMLVIGRMERGPDPAKGEGDTGVNFLAVAWDKAAQMISTRTASGTQERAPLKGEMPYRGGLIDDGMPAYLTAFSGGSEDEDVLVAQAGMDALKT